MRDEFELRVLIERLIVNRLEDRLRVGREALIGIPGGNVVRPADGRGIVGAPMRATAAPSRPAAVPMASCKNDRRRSRYAMVCAPSAERLRADYTCNSQAVMPVPRRSNA